jgi:hypothetical protein
MMTNLVITSPQIPRSRMTVPIIAGGFIVVNHTNDEDKLILISENSFAILV